MIDFFDAVWGENPDLLGEFRVISPLRIHQTFVPLTRRDIALELDTMSVLSRSADVYYGVMPRTSKAGTNESCIPTTSVLWADIDAKDFPSQDDALSTLSRMYAYPQIVVDSGHGYHAYWLLTFGIDYDLAREYMRGIAREVGGDNVSDAARILRVPGTLNHKHDQAMPVRLLRFDTTRRYAPGTFADYNLSVVRPVQHDFGYTRLSQGDIPEWLLDLIRDGAPKGARSGTVFKVALWMTRYGYTAEDIRSIVTAHPGGIGAKWVEKKRDGDRWLDLTIRAAQEKA